MYLKEDKLLNAISKRISSLDNLNSNIEKVEELEKLKDVKIKELFSKSQELEFITDNNLGPNLDKDLVYNVDLALNEEFMNKSGSKQDFVDKKELVRRKYLNVKVLLENMDLMDNSKEIKELLSNALKALNLEDFEKLKVYESRSLKLLQDFLENGNDYGINLYDLILQLNDEDKSLITKTREYEDSLCEEIQRLDKLINSINEILLAILPSNNKYIM